MTDVFHTLDQTVSVVFSLTALEASAARPGGPGGPGGPGIITPETTWTLECLCISKCDNSRSVCLHHGQMKSCGELSREGRLRAFCSLITLHQQHIYSCVTAGHQDGFKQINTWTSRPAPSEGLQDWAEENRGFVKWEKNTRDFWNVKYFKDFHTRSVLSRRSGRSWRSRRSSDTTSPETRCTRVSSWSWMTRRSNNRFSFRSLLTNQQY